MTYEISALLVILITAIVTYALRLGGLLLATKLPNSGRVRSFMNALPGTILISLVAPEVMAAGLWGVIATGCTALTAYKTKNIFISMLVGVLIMAIQRNF